MSTVLILHGEKPLPCGSIHPAFLHRIETAKALLCHHRPVAIIITGGKTVTKSLSEAEMALPHFADVDIPIVLENAARTTVENAKNSIRLIKAHFPEVKKIIIVTSQIRIARAKAIYHHLFAELSHLLDFHPAPNGLVRFADFESLHRVKEWLAHAWFWLDAKEKAIITKYWKRLFRNADE